DLGEEQVLALVQNAPAKIVVSIIGGQGYILGRGNQQISARVIARVGIEHITVAATMEKIASLRDNLLRVDTGEPALDDRLCGWRRVITGYQTDSVCRVAL
ncbi:MAG: ATP-NAD kinase, partial [Alphaproteobacteria bacterium]|nr:ATP-NAD kinase [Alphaproteobacteria bacterium]